MHERVPNSVTSADEAKADPGVVAALYLEHADGLRCFVRGLLRDNDLAADVTQMTFVKAVQSCHEVRRDSLKAWLYRVAYHEAMAIRRRQDVDQRAKQKLAWQGSDEGDQPEANLARWEQVQAVRQALDTLPDAQRQVVRMRIYEQKKFADIASELDLPLGTVLTRMQLGLKKLRGQLAALEDDPQSPD